MSPLIFLTFDNIVDFRIPSPAINYTACASQPSFPPTAKRFSWTTLYFRWRDFKQYLPYFKCDFSLNHSSYPPNFVETIFHISCQSYFDAHIFFFTNSLCQKSRGKDGKWGAPDIFHLLYFFLSISSEMSQCFFGGLFLTLSPFLRPPPLSFFPLSIKNAPMIVRSIFTNNKGPGTAQPKQRCYECYSQFVLALDWCLKCD